MCKMCDLLKTGVLENSNPPEVVQVWCGEKRIVPEAAIMVYVEAMEAAVAEHREGFRYPREDVAVLAIAFMSLSIERALDDMADELMVKAVVLRDPTVSPGQVAAYIAASEMAAKGVPTRFGEIVDELIYDIGWEPEKEEGAEAESASDLFQQLMAQVGEDMAADD